MASEISSFIKNAWYYAQQEMIGQSTMMGLKPALLPVDKAAVLARREVERLVAAERTEGVAK